MLENIKSKLTNGLAKIIAVITLFAVQAFAQDNPYVLMQQASDRLFGDIAVHQSKIQPESNF